MITLREVIEKSKEKEESDNLAVKALFHIINNVAYGIYMIFLLCVIVGAFAFIIGLFVATPFWAISLFEDGHMIGGGVVGIISLGIWGAAFRMT